MHDGLPGSRAGLQRDPRLAAKAGAAATVCRHSHAPADFGRAFAIGVALNALYVALEATFGIFSGSLALLADAGHNLCDVLGPLLAWSANWLAKRKHHVSRAYGFKREPILASLRLHVCSMQHC